MEVSKIIPIFAPASKEVSMCYGTLPRGGICPSVVFLIEMSVLEKQSLATLLIQPDFHNCCTHIDSCYYCLSNEPVRSSLSVVDNHTGRLLHTVRDHSSHLLFLPRFFKTFVFIELVFNEQIWTLPLVFGIHQGTEYRLVLLTLEMASGENASRSSFSGKQGGQGQDGLVVWF